MKKTTFFVGNIPPRCGEEDIKKIFLQFGSVRVRMGIDKNTGRQKGFAFVEVLSEKEGSQIRQAIGSATIDRKVLKIEEEKEKPLGERRPVRNRRIL